MTSSQLASRDARLDATSTRVPLPGDAVAELLEGLPDAMVVVDRDWCITHANRQASVLFARAREALVGRPRAHSLFGALGAGAWERLHDAMSTRTPVELEVLAAPPERWLEVCATPFRDGLLVRMRDVSAYRRADAERQRLLELSRRTAAQAMLLQRLTAALSSALSAREVSAVVLEQALPALGATAGDVGLLSDDGSEFHVLCWMGYPEEAVRPWMRYPVDAGTPGGDIVRTGQPVFLASIDEWARRYPRVAPILAAVGLSAYAGVPLEFEGRVLGTVSFNFPDERAFADDERALLVAFGHQCAQALERARLFEAEQRARAEAERANQAKSDFLAVMSHELRTPLTAILGYEELLADGVSGPVTEPQRQQLDRIRVSAMHLLQLIEELLAYTRLEARRETAHLAAVPLAAVFDEALTLVAPLAAARGLALRSSLSDPALACRTDAGKLRQVLVNLLSNAVKFTERGEVSLAARTEPRDERAEDVVIEVRDTGIGIAPEHLERIFEPFWQVEQHVARRAGGTGLGLSVSRALVELLGGRLEVSSRVGEGSVFALRLPGGRGA
ncbi:MAG TPA: ATP-binding protein [Gemmatimonadaceae bacterium]|nr:ATP-binding protein [Gemmatimonadaceae bacterium]